MNWIYPDTLTGSHAQYLTALIGATLLTAISKGGFGGGLGVIATPLLLLVLPANVALSMLLPILIVCDLFTLRQFPKEWDRPSFNYLASGATLGLLAGLGLLLYFGREGVNGDRGIRLLVGAVSLAFCLIQIWRWLRRESASAKPIGRVGGWGFGVLAGITTMVAHAAGPLVSMFLVMRRIDRQRFVGTSARYFLTFNTIKVPIFLLASVLADKDYITWHTLRWSLWVMPLCPLGVAAGAWMNRRISGAWFTRIVYVLLFLTGARMLQQSLF